MARVATVELRNTKTRQVVIRNASDYDPARDKDWKIVESRSVEDMNISDVSVAPNTPVAEKPAPEPKEDWTSMKWADARKFIKGETGVYPKSKAHAAELMS